MNNKEIIVSYITAIGVLLAVVLSVILRTGGSFSKGQYDYLFFVVSLLVFALALGPFLIMGLVGFYKKKYLLNAIGGGFIVWIIITSLIVIVNYLTINQKIMFLMWLMSIFIAGFLISFYKLSKSLIWLSFLLGPFSNLYYLIYGMYQKNTKNINAKL